ncbi:MAG: nuclear transport factor 2 family protein [Gammaproteobacteria bacterium]
MSESNAAVLQRLFEAFNRHDIDGVLDCMTEDCVFFPAAGPEAFGTRLEGHDALRQAFTGVWGGIPDVQWENCSHYADGDLGLSQWTFTGTNANGGRIEVNGCDIFSFRDGKVASKNAFRKDRVAA